MVSIDPGGTLKIVCSNCSTTYLSKSYRCTDYSEVEDWQTGIGSTTFTADPGMEDFYISYDNCCWITLNNGGWTRYDALAHVDLNPYNGVINSSPNTSMSTIRVQHGCSQELHIPGTETCVLALGSSLSIGWYAVTINVEDFASASSTTPKSSVPLQFLIQVYYSPDPCSDKPSFVAPTPEDGACYGIAPGMELSFPIRAARGITAEIVLFQKVSPSNLETSAISYFNNSAGPDEYFTTVTWTPTESQIGRHVVCFSALDENSRTSPTRCVNLRVEDDAPTAIRASLDPSESDLWRLELMFSHNVSLPTSSAFVRIYLNGSLVYSVDVSLLSNASLIAKEDTFQIFLPSANLTMGQSYYVMLDGGVAVGPEPCPISSKAMVIGTKGEKYRQSWILNTRMNESSEPSCVQSARNVYMRDMPRPRKEQRIEHVEQYAHIESPTYRKSR
ncbi:uncharacterized protein LOC119735253 [Patiria miniata]|uniref:Uncharacterized protein n=1 Tax=Patiria miniata TaxID=46514 RepID=A0A914AN04_PATMI|nr:uncharacterized protein LOC119735253 [Patiria miniata]